MINDEKKRIFMAGYNYGESAVPSEYLNDEDSEGAYEHFLENEEKK